MPIPQRDVVTGALPRGRYLCTMDEIEAEFVSASWCAASSTRSKIWEDFSTTLQLYDEVSPGLATAVWVGGSFTTAKVDPDDIDVTVLLDPTVYGALSNNKQHRVDRISAREPGGQVSRLRARLGLRVDCFAVICAVVPMPWQGLSAEEADYFRTRGLWDDWWQRILGGPKGSMPTTTDALPVRGYLEVLR